MKTATEYQVQKADGTITLRSKELSDAIDMCKKQMLLANDKRYVFKVITTVFEEKINF